jgi:hypothetical protein
MSYGENLKDFMAFQPPKPNLTLSGAAANTCNFFQPVAPTHAGNNYARQRVKMHQLRKPLNSAHRPNHAYEPGSAITSSESKQSRLAS